MMCLHYDNMKMRVNSREGIKVLPAGEWIIVFECSKCGIKTTQNYAEYVNDADKFRYLTGERTAFMAMVIASSPPSKLLDRLAKISKRFSLFFSGEMRAADCARVAVLMSMVNPPAMREELGKAIDEATSHAVEDARDEAYDEGQDNPEPPMYNEGMD